MTLTIDTVYFQSLCAGIMRLHVDMRYTYSLENCNFMCTCLFQMNCVEPANENYNIFFVHYIF